MFDAVQYLLSNLVPVATWSARAESSAAIPLQSFNMPSEHSMDPEAEPSDSMAPL